MKVYLVRMAKEETKELFYKIGTTQFRDTMHRFTKHGDNTVQNSDLSKMEKLARAFQGQTHIHPYLVEVLHEVTFADSAHALLTEREILDIVIPSAGYQPRIPFSGQSECFLADQMQLDELVAYMTGICAERGAEAPSAPVL